VKFLAADSKTKEIAKTALMARNLAISVLIGGERGAGKTTLAKYIAPDAAVINADRDSGNPESEINEILLRTDAIIIENFDKINNLDRIDLGEKKVIATTTKNLNSEIIDHYFGLTLFLQPLSDRPNDTLLLAEMFLNEAKNLLGIDEKFNLKNAEFDLSLNAISLRKSVLKFAIINSLDEQDLLSLMQKFLREKLRSGTSENIYRDFLYLYEKPLIAAGLAQYGSQLRLSAALGINRNTLRKKVYELDVK
jgi:DNA-binding NtrC family response regulator